MGKAMRNDLSETLWVQTACAAPETPALDSDLDVSVVVVGGGYTGLSTALHLAQAGVEVAVLEAREIGHGGSGRNSGHCTPTFHFRPDFSLANLKKRLGEERAGRLIELQTGGAEQVFGLIEKYAIDCDPVRAGCLHAAHTPSTMAVLEQKHAEYQTLSKPMRLLDAAAIAQATGSDKFHGGWLYEDAGNVQPLSYARGLAAAALQEGARVFTDSPVVSIKKSGARWRLATARGSVTADQVVIATGAYSDALWPGLRRTYAPFTLATAATEPLSEDLRRSILPDGNHLVDTRRDTFAVKYDAQGRLVSTFNVSGRRARDPEYMKRVVAGRFRWAWPQLGDVRWQFYWPGTIDLRPDLFPRLFELAPGVVTAIGFSGRGVPTGTALGSVLADFLTGTPREELRAPLEAPSKVPPLMSLIAPRMVPYFRHLDAKAMRADGLKPPRF